MDIFDATTSLGSALTNVSGAWSFVLPTTIAGNHIFNASSTTPDAVVLGAPNSLAASIDPDRAATEVVIADGGIAEIQNANDASVTFAGNTGTLKLDHSLAFTGQVTALRGSDAIDLSDVTFGSQTQATFLGNTSGGTLTITDGIRFC